MANCRGRRQVVKVEDAVGVEVKACVEPLVCIAASDVHQDVDCVGEVHASLAVEEDGIVPKSDELRWDAHAFGAADDVERAIRDVESPLASTNTSLGPLRIARCRPS